MSTESNNPIAAAAQAVTTQTEPAAESTEQGNPAEAALGDAGKKALDLMKAERNEAKRMLAETKARLDAIEAANMSDLERAQKAAAEAQAQVENVPQMVADQLRGHLTAIHSISEEDRDLYLTSSDPAILLKQAVGIATRTQTQATTTPKPDLTQGAQNAAALNGDALTEALARAVGAR